MTKKVLCWLLPSSRSFFMSNHDDGKSTPYLICWNKTIAVQLNPREKSCACIITSSSIINALAFRAKHPVSR
jgi:hypothetical protein